MGKIRISVVAGFPWALLLAAAWIVLPPSAHGREILRSRFERVPAGVRADNTALRRDGSPGGYSRPETGFWLDKDAGDFLDAPVSFGGNVTRGSISFDLQRKQGTVPPDRRTVFEILDAEGRQLLFFQIQWSCETDPSRPMVHFRGPRYWAFGRALWPSAIPLEATSRQVCKSLTRFSSSSLSRSRQR